MLRSTTTRLCKFCLIFQTALPRPSLILHHSCGALDWGVNTFFFEAFDEPWKPHSTGDNGQASDETHWGAMNADRSQKFSLKC